MMRDINHRAAAEIVARQLDRLESCPDADFGPSFKAGGRRKNSEGTRSMIPGPRALHHLTCDIAHLTLPFRTLRTTILSQICSVIEQAIRVPANEAILYERTATF